MISQVASPKKLRIAVTFLGPLRPRLDVEILEPWQSNFFDIENLAAIDELSLPEPGCGRTNYSDDDLDELLAKPDGYDILVAIIDAPLEDEYYMRRLKGNRVVISVYDIAPLLIQHGYSFNAFVYRNLYQLLVAFHASSNSLPPTTKKKLAHTPTRGCLFDWNDNKQDILNSLDHPSVCRVCEERYVKGGPLASHMSELRSELYRIQRPLHVRGLEWLNRKIARHPWLTLGVAVLSGIALNLVASYLFEWLK
ncbi:hypothetical protein ACEUC3_18625 [Aeromonas bivalvium]|uniref:hypothetical protein n=1 Tax=Aeromonas bivalvium TaxID=440079 RepID=UPI0038D1232D